MLHAGRSMPLRQPGRPAFTVCAGAATMSEPHITPHISPPRALSTARLYCGMLLFLVACLAGRTECCMSVIAT